MPWCWNTTRPDIYYLHSVNLTNGTSVSFPGKRRGHSGVQVVQQDWQLSRWFVCKWSDPFCFSKYPNCCFSQGHIKKNYITILMKWEKINQARKSDAGAIWVNFNTLCILMKGVACFKNFCISSIHIFLFHSKNNNIYMNIESRSTCLEVAILHLQEFAAHGSAQGSMISLWHHSSKACTSILCNVLPYH